jgi:D-3-phosphoglycerate dehydrogenase
VTPQVHLGPDEDPAITEAIRAGGGAVAPLQEADAVVWLDSNPDTLGELPARVRWVQLPAAGVERWTGRITPDGPAFTSAAGAYGAAVAEHALALLLAGVRGLVGAARAARWDPRFGGTLEGSTVAIVGAGGIGRALIGLLVPHDVEVIAVTRRGRDVPGAARTLGADALADVWGAADHVVIAAPATGSTRHLVGAEQLAAMRPHAWLVNVARGSLVDTDALVAALHDGAIGGAALDVTDPEPLPDDHPLWTLDGVFLTPHIAGDTPEAERAAQALARAQMLRHRAGLPLENVVRPGAAGR